MPDLVADVVIAGGGSAGAVLAARLSENAALKVILVEAGRDSTGLMVALPAGSFRLMGNKKADWNYTTEPDPSIEGRVSAWSGGRMLGGSSSINGMIYVRGQREDYDRWVSAGAKGWGWDELLPYFLRAQNYAGPTSPHHGEKGPLGVGLGGARHPLVDPIMAAFEANGIPPRKEYCAGDQFGTFEPLTTTRDGKRQSTARTYLKQAGGRSNLVILTETLVDRVIVKDGRATGLKVCGPQGERTIRGREIIVSAGTIGSPAILMRSGIGPAEHLRAHGIDPLVDLPVGRNLQEHCGATQSKFVDMPTYNSPFSPYTIIRDLARWAFTRRGPMASAAVHLMAAFKSSPKLEEPDLSMSFIPLAVDFKDGRPSMHKRPGVSMGAMCMRPDSRGEIRLRTANPNDKPIIDHRLLGDSRDIERLIAGSKIIAEIWSTSPLADHVVGDIMPPNSLESDAEWEEYIRRNATIGYHPVGTCRMGGADAVLDPQLRVQGVEGLRVVDASVMPLQISGNTNAATIAIAEKAAEMISL